jgi:glycogen(starch) synthase
MSVSVLHVTTSYPRESDPGVGHFVHDLVEAQRRLGMKVTVAHPPTAGVLGDMRSPLRWPKVAYATFVMWARALRHARHADVVHAHWWPTAVVARWAGAKRVVVTLHGSDVALMKVRPLRRLAQRTLEKSCASFAVSDFLAREIEREIGHTVTAVVAHGDAVAGLQTEPAQRSGIVFAGGLRKNKGAQDLPALLRMLRARGVEEPLHIYSDGDLFRELFDELQPELAQGHCFLHGSVQHDQVLSHISSAALVVCPSYFEGFGLVCREAVNRGVPVAGYAVGGLVEQLADTPHGLLVEAGDVAGLADAAATLLADGELRNLLWLEARRKNLGVDSWEDVARQLGARYESVITAG